MNRSVQANKPALSAKQNCWFCNSRSKPASSLKLKFRKNLNSNIINGNFSDPLYSIPVEFRDQYNVAISIPRCRTCKTLQIGGTLIYKTIYFLIPIMALILYFVNLIVLMAVIVLGAILYPFREKFEKLIPAFVKRRLPENAYQHPEVKNLTQKGWILK